jgi:hypothetical protein
MPSSVLRHTPTRSASAFPVFPLAAPALKRACPEDPVLVPLQCLRPTQGAVGMKAVAAKREKVERRTDSRKAITR